jgi:hypothetical protein
MPKFNSKITEKYDVDFEPTSATIFWPVAKKVYEVEKMTLADVERVRAKGVKYFTPKPKAESTSSSNSTTVPIKSK